MGIKCSKCQSDNPETATFCADCGTKLISPKGIDITETAEVPKEELTTGSTFAGRYQIIEELGKGGMGRIYKVHDTEIKEKVALKLLRPEIASDEKTIERFRNEVRSARKISHRNVGRMFDLGKSENTYYITMEYVEGENLKNMIRMSGQLGIGTTISLAKQVCEGLAEAHKLGVVHRDLKPSNIMIDREGSVRIMDFGIARSLKEKGITSAGVMIGTPEYMSPEQVEGKEVDQQTDIYSLGIILYEMLTGRVPFEGDTALMVAVKHRTETPKEPKDYNEQILDDLNGLILRCLEKDKKKRYQSAGELLSELENIEKGIPSTEREITVTFGLKKLLVPALVVVALVIITMIIWRLIPRREAVTVLSDKPSIAVLPVEDLSLHKDQEPLCEGLHDDIIIKLSSLEELRVVPKISIKKYKDSDKDIKKIAEELNVNSILALTLQKEKNIVRVNGLLINAKEGFAIRTYQFERNFESYFNIQDEISNDIAKTLDVHPTEEKFKAIKRREPSDIEVYEYYVKGKYFEDKYFENVDEEDFKTAESMYQKAINIDPNYAIAYYGLGNINEHRYAMKDDKKALDLMMKNYQKAFEIDPDLPEANLGLGWAYFFKEDLDNAYDKFKRAFKIDMNSSEVNFNIGSFLRSIGLFRQAIKSYSRAIKIDPIDTRNYELLAVCHIAIGEYKEAIIQLKEALKIEPDNFGLHRYYAEALIMMKKYSEAEQEIALAEKLNPNLQSSQYLRAWMLAGRGERDKSLTLIKGAPPYHYITTSIYSLLNMKEEAIEDMKMGIDVGFEKYKEYIYCYYDLLTNSCYDSLHDDQRFKEILKQQKKKHEERLEKYGDL